MYKSVSPKRLSAVSASVESLIAWYESVPSDLRFEWGAWYRRALAVAEDLGREHGVKRSVAIALLAITSQQLGWSKNVEVASLAMQGIYAHPLPSVCAKCMRLMAGESPEDVVSGQKITRFWKSILSGGTCDEVCIDRWALRAAVPEWASVLAGDVTISPPAYSVLEAMYVEAARRVGITGPEFQAIVWCAVRGSAD